MSIAFQSVYLMNNNNENISINTYKNIIVTDYNSNQIKVYGEATIECFNPDRKLIHTASFSSR